MAIHTSHSSHFYKEVALVHSDESFLDDSRQGAPRFVSKDERRSKACDTCGGVYSPLQYAVGELVVAQHFHLTESRYEDGGGGIYFYEADADQMYGHIVKGNAYRWIAKITPVGQIEKHEFLKGMKIVRAEAVVIDALTTYDWRGDTIRAGEIVDSGDGHAGLYSRSFERPDFPLPDKRASYLFEMSGEEPGFTVPEAEL